MRLSDSDCYLEANRAIVVVAGSVIVDVGAIHNAMGDTNHVRAASRESHGYQLLCNGYVNYYYHLLKTLQIP